MPTPLKQLAALLLGLLGLYLAGCSGESPLPAPPGDKADRRLHFEPGEEPRHVFFLTESWDGGGGDPVLLSYEGRGGTLRYKGKPVYLQGKAQQQIRSRLGPPPKENPNGRILVEARAHLEPASARVSTDPPSTRSIYTVILDELIHVEWYVPSDR